MPCLQERGWHDEKFNVLMTMCDFFMNTCIKLTIFFHFDIHIKKSSSLVLVSVSEFYCFMTLIDFRNEIVQLLFTVIPNHENGIKEP